MYSRILVPVDGSAPAECGLREAIRMAQVLRARLVVLNIVNEFPIMMDPVSLSAYDNLIDTLRRHGEEIARRAAKAAADAGVDCECVVVDAVSGSAAPLIVKQVGESRCELIVMGTHGRRGLKRLALGSDAELVVRNAGVPVLLVKPPENAG